MQSTEHYALNLFEGSDHVLAENFNANTEIIDAELAKKIRGESYTYTGSGEKLKVFSFSSQPLFVVLSATGSGDPVPMGFGVYGNNGVLVHNGTSNLVTRQRCTWSGSTLTFDIRGSGVDAANIFNANGTEYRVTALLA
ncbi:MAG: hypothetical protein IJT18_01975 [Oscillospiraceae bacterium]|nr:hypothetical protein [Oscillospiraceae bacterium]